MDKVSLVSFSDIWIKSEKSLDKIGIKSGYNLDIIWIKGHGRLLDIHGHDFFLSLRARNSKM